MHNLSKDFKGQRPLLIQPSQAEAYLNRVNELDVPLNAKMSDMGEMLAAVFGYKAKLEKFPPVAIIPVKGVIGKNLSELESLCGSCDINDVEEMLEECERDPSIKTIILDIDSPGGTSVGVPELANRIKHCSKEVISFTENECCSAAYWLGSQASSFYATPSSSVGSIGVYIAFPDYSEAYKMEGVKMDVIKSGAYKGAGIPGTSLDDAQREMLQKEVEEIHVDFKEAVKSVRSFVEDSSMEGQTFSGKKGAEAGLVTSLINGFDELVQTIDASVHAAVEAEEEKEEQEEDALAGDVGIKAKSFAEIMSEADSAISSFKARSSEEGEDEEDEDKKSEDEDEEKKSEDEDEEKKSEDEDEEKKSEDEDEDKQSEDEDEDKKSEDDEEEKKSEGDEDDEKKSEGDEDEDKDPKSEDKEDDEKKSEGDEDGVEPQPDDEEEPEEGKSKEDAEDEDDSGEKAVDTDSKHNSSGVKKNRSKGVA
jgi:signal peptide peptidase SppA